MTLWESGVSHDIDSTVIKLKLAADVSFHGRLRVRTPSVFKC